MTVRPHVSRRGWRPVPAGIAGSGGGARRAVAALALANLIGNRWIPSVAYVPWNVAVATGLVAMARRAGSGVEDLGLARDAFGRSLRAGGAGAAAVGVLYAVLAVTGRGGALLRDSRLTTLDRRSALVHLLVRIPIGTALAEEVMFRSALPALLASDRRPSWLPGVAASALFGLWHVLPSNDRSRANAVPDASSSSLREIAATVGATAIAGALLDLARRRTGHLAAPVVLHTAANAFGFVAVRLVDGRR